MFNRVIDFFDHLYSPTALAKVRQPPMGLRPFVSYFIGQFRAAFIIRIVSAAIAFLSQIVQARMMGEFEYGIFVFVWVLAILVGNLSCLGFHSTVVRFLPHYRALGDHESLHGLTITARIFSMGMATVTAALGLLALWLLAPHIAGYYIVPAFLALFLLPMIALGEVLEGTARASSWALISLSPTYIIRPVLILLFMIVAVSSGAPATATTAMLCALAATYLTSLSQLVTVSRRLSRHFRREGMTIRFGAWFRVAVPIFLIEGFGFLLTNSDVVVVGMTLPPEEVAIYFAAAKTMAIMQFVFFSVKAASAPRFSSMIAEGNRQALAESAVESARWSFWPSLVIGTLLLLSGHFILSLFGPAFPRGIDLMIVLFLGLMTKASIGPGEVLLTMAGHQKLCAWLYAGALLVNIGLNVALIPLYGAVGAALATAFAMGAETLLLHLAVRRVLGFRLFAFARPVAAAPVPGV